MDGLGKYRCYQWRHMSGVPKKRLFQILTGLECEISLAADYKTGFNRKKYVNDSTG